MSGVLGALVWNKTITLTNAQIKTLPTTPFEVLAAPGSGRALIGELAVLNFHIVGNYTNIDVAGNSPYITIAPSNDFIEPFSYIANTGSLSYLNIALNTPSRVFTLVPSQAISETAFGLIAPPLQTSSLDNNNLSVFCINALGNFTGGNAANTLTVTVFYRLIEL